MDQKNETNETNETNEQIERILKQTNYTKEEAREKLLENDMDEIQVIKKYLGIPEKKTQPIKSLQQEIYKQIRYQMDDSMRTYNEKQHNKLKKEIDDLMNA
jgi:endonuclease III